MEKIETDILIIGGGWSGLAAADFLSQEKRNIVILEKESEIGGLARTFDLGGFKFDYGGHGVFFKKDENLNYIKSIINNNSLLVLKRNIKILFNNGYIDYPPNLSSIFRIDKKYIFEIFFDMLRLDRNCEQRNFEEWAKANYGECLYRTYFKDYTEKVWGKQCSELSSDWADKRIGSNNLFKLVKAMLSGNGYCKDNRPLFYYRKNGIFSLLNLLRQRIKNKNCQVYKNVQLKQISANNEKLVSLSFILDGRQYEISFKHIISSIPIVELMKIFPYDMASSFHEALQEIKYRNLIIVSCIINRELLTNWYWCYFPSKEVLFSRIHEPKFWSKDMAPDDNTLLCMEILCNYDDLYWNMEDEEIIKQVRSALKYTGLLNAKDAILDACVKRIKYAYPLHYNGFEKPLNQVKSFLSFFKNLYLTGRSGTHSYLDMEECLDDIRKKIKSLQR